MKKKLIVIDISSFIFRAFYAIRPLHAPDGTPVNAVHGVFNMLLKLFSVYRPTHVLVARDTSGPSFRHKIFPEYKANRSAPPEDLIPQFEIIKSLIKKMNLPYDEHQDYEADDIIGSSVTKWKDKFDEILIASGDKDLMQFVDEKIKMVDTMKDKIYGPKEVKEKMGVRPDQIVDYLSMVGDTSDNIKGMKGIGAKGAAKLLAEYDTLENIAEHKDELKNKRVKTAFEEHFEEGMLSKKLIKIPTDIDLGISAEEVSYRFDPHQDLIDFLQKLGFKSAVRKMQELAHNEVKAQEGGSFSISTPVISQKSFEQIIVQDGDSLNNLEDELTKVESICVYTEYSSDDLYRANLLGISLSFDGKKGFYISVARDQDQSKKISKKLLEKIWGNEKVNVISDHLQKDYLYAQINGIPFNAKLCDILQKHFVIDSGERHELTYLAQKYLDHSIPMRGKGDLPLFEESIECETNYFVERACCCYQLHERFKLELDKLQLHKVYDKVDCPTISVLAKMEKVGILLEPKILNNLSSEFQRELDLIEGKIEKESDEKINLKSPKQVSELLFKTLQLPVIKKTKTGHSTDSEVLVELDSRGLSIVPAMILKYRELEKLLSTYVNVLPNLINPVTNRLHTHFNQHVASTGRLSSDRPNLQNIPIRSENGRKIRKAFVAAPGNILLSADYSQVELRLLAHFAGDQTMIKAFKEGKDIHSQTAAEILNIPIDEITSKERSKAKAVNFGLMYGQSSFGLAKQLRISRTEAKEYIARYFHRFHQVKSYLDSLKEYAAKHGYSKTLHGRKRFLPDIHSKNRTIKSMAERVAVNSPIQGTAADIIKLAMIQIDKILTEKNLKTKMLLQVHDELIFEIPKDEEEVVTIIVREQMEGVVQLQVPLLVQLGTGLNWYDLK